MKTIPQELVKFKSTVSPSIGKMNSEVTNISGKLSDTINANNTAKDGIDTYYNSKNKDTVLAKFTYLNDIYNKINDSLSSDLSKMLQESSKIIEKVTELEDINKQIGEKEQEISELEQDVDEEGNCIHGAEIAALRDDIKSLETRFDAVRDEALALLSGLKGMDKSLSIIS